MHKRDKPTMPLILAPYTGEVAAFGVLLQTFARRFWAWSLWKGVQERHAKDLQRRHTELVLGSLTAHHLRDIGCDAVENRSTEIIRTSW